MNAQTKICPPDLPDVEGRGVDLADFMRANDILRVGIHAGNVNVYMTADENGRDRFGCGKSFDEAFDNARRLS